MHKKLSIYFSLLILFISLHFSISAQNYSFSLHIPDAADSSIFLAHHFNGQIYVDDTIKLDDQGKGILKGDTLLQQGLYVLYLDKDHFTDFLLGEDQEMKITHNFSQPEELKISGAKDSELFNAYKGYLNKMKKKQKSLMNRREQNKNNEVILATINDSLRFLNNEITAYWFSEAEKYPNLFYSKFLLSSYVPAIKEGDIPGGFLANDSLRWVYEYNFRKNHYWDYFDVSDERFLFTPVLKPRLENYFNRMLIQKPDSVLPYVFQVIEKTRKNEKMFRYMTTTLLNNFISSKMMGMDAVFVRIAERYYLSGQASWADSTTYTNIAQQVYFKRNNLLGMTAKDFKMESSEGPYYRLSEFNTDYTVLVFWEPDCGHCKTQVPQLYNDVYKSLKDESVSFVAIYTMNDKEKWTKKIEEEDLFEWINLWDPDNLTDFRVNYDIQTTPYIYILDKNKKILAKKITPEATKQILELLLAGKSI